MRFLRVKTGLLVVLSICLWWAANAEESQPPESKHTLWRVSSGKNSVYLVGSLHLLKKENYPLAEAIEKAFDDSQNLVFEVDPSRLIDPESQKMMLRKAMLPEEDSLEKRISKETYAFAKDKLDELGMDISVFSRYKPWFLTTTLTVAKFQALGFNPQFGLDIYFHSKALEAGKPVTGLETFEYQLDLFDSLSGLDHDQLVLQALKDLDMIEAEMDAILKAWLTGDVEVLEAAILEGFKEYPRIYELLITKRNWNWMSQVESFLEQEKNHMVIVGSAHLVGDGGLVELLKKRGHSVEQL